MLKNVCGREGGKEGRRGTRRSCLEGLHTPRCREPRQDQDGREGCQGQEPGRTAKGTVAVTGQSTRYRTGAPNSTGFPPEAEQMPCAMAGAAGPSPLLSVPSSNKPLSVPSSTPQPLKVCKNPGLVPQESRYGPCPKSRNYIGSWFKRIIRTDRKKRNHKSTRRNHGLCFLFCFVLNLSMKRTFRAQDKGRMGMSSARSEDKHHAGESTCGS